MGRVDIEVKMIRVEQDRQLVVLELRYGRHRTDLSRAMTWWRNLWHDSEPHEAHCVKMYRPIVKDMADTQRRLRLALGSHRLLTVQALGVTRRPSNCRLAGRVALLRRWCHRWRVVPDLEFEVVRGRPRGEWSSPWVMVAPMPLARDDSRKGTEPHMKGYEKMQAQPERRLLQAVSL